MDKISSYPMRFLEAVPGRIKIGPERQVIGEAHHLAPFLYVWPAIMAQYYMLGTNSKTVPISKKASFSQNKIMSFSKNDIKLFFQKLGNFKNYLLIN